MVYRSLSFHSWLSLWSAYPYYDFFYFRYYSYEIKLCDCSRFLWDFSSKFCTSNWANTFPKIIIFGNTQIQVFIIIWLASQFCSLKNYIFLVILVNLKAERAPCVKCVSHSVRLQFSWNFPMTLTIFQLLKLTHIYFSGISIQGMRISTVAVKNCCFLEDSIESSVR